MQGVLNIFSLKNIECGYSLGVPNYWLISGKWWLRSDMTDKLLTGTSGKWNEVPKWSGVTDSLLI